MESGRQVCRLWQRAVLGMVLLSSSFLGAATAQVQPPEENRNEMEELRASRWAKSKEQLLVAPYYSNRPGETTKLLVVNRFADPIDLVLVAHSSSGESRPLDVEILEPRETAEINLREALQGAPRDFQVGSLRLSYFGDPEMIQAWVVLSGRGELEVPLTKKTGFGAWQWFSFWDTRPFLAAAQSEPYFVFHNTEDTLVTVEVVANTAVGPAEVYREQIPPGGTATLKPKSHGRWAAAGLQIRQDGSPGQVVAAGFLEGRNVLTALPIMTPSEIEAARAFFVPALPFELTPPDAPVALVLSLFNPAVTGEPKNVHVVLRDLDGLLVFEHQLVLEPWETRALDLSSLPHGAQSVSGWVRMELTSTEGGVIPHAYGLVRDGGVIDVALVPQDKAHDGGTYPLADLKSNDVFTTFLNLGSEPATIVSQIQWDRGTYALEPFTVPAGTSYRLDFRTIAEQGKPDPAGRRLDGNYERAFFQWFSRRGSSQLIARTEVRRKESLDVIGFNCYGCCEELPWGAVIPSSLAFDTGEQPLFQPVEYVDTCSGTLGPYEIYPAYKTFFSPLSWSSSNILSTVDYTHQTVGFEEKGYYQWVDCSDRLRTVRGAGPVTVDRCMAQHGPPGFDEGQSCAAQTGSCTSCYDCCEKLKQVGYCRCDQQMFGRTECKAGVRFSCGTCKQTCFGTFLDSCSEQLSSCPV